MAIEKSSDGCAGEVIGENWPSDNEDDYEAAAKAMLDQASKAQKAAQITQQGQQYAADQTESGTTEALQKLSGVHINEHLQQAEDFAKAAGWLKYMATAIKSAKIAINEAAHSHQVIHDTPLPAGNPMIGGTTKAQKDAQELKDKDMERAQGLVVDAKATSDSALDTGERALAAASIPTPFGGTPEIPEEASDPARSGQNVGPGGMPSDLPGAATPVSTDPGLTPGAANPNPLQPSPFWSDAAGQTGAGQPGATGGQPATPAPAPALTPSDFAAPPTGPAMAPPAAAETGSSSEGSGMSGMPMGGMPMGMPMQQPQMPQGGGAPSGMPGGGDPVKTGADMITKLAGKDGVPGGTAVTPETLDKLLAAQGDGAGGDHKAPELGGPDTDDGKSGDNVDENGHKKDNAHAQTPGGKPPTDPYSPANARPELNNPAASHNGAPSPAMPAVTPAPSPVSLPMTELSASDAVPPPAAPVSHSAAQAPGPSFDAGHTQTSAAGPGGGQPPAPSPGATQQPSPGGALGAYPSGPGGVPPGGMVGGAPMVPPPMMPMTGAGGGAPAAPPVLAAVPAAVGGTAAAAHVLTREVNHDGPLQRVLELRPEYAAAENHLAGLLKAFDHRQWVTALIAVGVFDHGTVLEPRLRYIVATADGLSLIPLGVSAPAGVELLSEQRVSATFRSDYNGHENPGKKLAALSKQHNHHVGQLVYLVSNDAAASLAPARAGEVTEVVQSKTETKALQDSHRASPAITPRTELVRRPQVRPEDAEAAVHTWREAWGFHDAAAADYDDAKAMLWSHRWGRSRQRHDEYPAILATYLVVEGLQALRDGRLDDAAYSAAEVMEIRPYNWAEPVHA